jgi:hypothetical protein
MVAGSDPNGLPAGCRERAERGPRAGRDRDLPGLRVHGDEPGDPLPGTGVSQTYMINLKTAKALGLTIPPSVLTRADEVIQ